MTHGQKAILLIKQFEGCKLEAYQCPAKVWTIGYGHTGGHVVKGLKITQKDADMMLNDDLMRVDLQLERIQFRPKNQNQYDAIVSFCFNLGCGSFEKSTLRKKINLNATEAEIRGEFMKWINAGGKPLQGLTNRRKAESDLYFTK